MRVGIWWIRRDLRLHDNPALVAAAAEGAVVPLFILDPHPGFSQAFQTPRGAFFQDSLRALGGALRARGGRLVVRAGPPIQVLEQVARETGASVVAAMEDVSLYARRRDADVAARLPLKLVGGPSVIPPHLMTRSSGHPYLIFGPFRRAWQERVSRQSLVTAAVPARLETPPGIVSDPLPPGPSYAGPFPPGEAEARRRLAAFLAGTDRIYRYDATRDRLDIEGTSGLSPYLRAGILSPREVAGEALRAIESAPDDASRANADRWLAQLIWREFYSVLLYHRPELQRNPLNPRFQDFPWLNDERDYAAWTAGRTGYPVVDAGMRQLQATGWMHNRARMVVASFLVKHLLIDWRWGARHFMQELVDGDPASNSGGWQWVGGTGTDAAPYVRVFNPSLQGRKCDPQGAYVRRWVPELARVPARHIHEPWRMTLDEQRQAGCRIGIDYPAPVVDHLAGRRRALAHYRGNRRTGQEGALR